MSALNTVNDLLSVLLKVTLSQKQQASRSTRIHLRHRHRPHRGGDPYLGANHLLVADNPQLVAHGRDEVLIVAHHKHAALKLGQGPDECLHRVEIQVIGGLVEQEEVGSTGVRMGPETL